MKLAKTTSTKTAVPRNSRRASVSAAPKVWPHFTTDGHPIEHIDGDDEPLLPGDEEWLAMSEEERLALPTVPHDVVMAMLGLARPAPHTGGSA